MSRRALLGAAGATAATALLAACTRTAPGGANAGKGGTLKFWNMPWGNSEFAALDKQITLGYKPESGLPNASYQSIQWANFTQTFATSVTSHTGPAVSSGGGTQAFQFAKSGFIAYADDLLEQWKSNGIFDDFLPNTVDAMKTEKGYVAVPYNIDMRVLWYRKSLLAKAEVEPPTDWQSYLDVSAALKKIGAYGFAASSGANGDAFQAIVSLMINNGGGIFDEEQKPNLVTAANIEALDFVVENVKKGYMDPLALGYSTTNANSQWQAGKFGMGIDVPGLAAGLTGSAKDDVVVGDPLVSAAGSKGALYFVNNVMMYTNTPSQKGSEAFLTYYYKNLAQLWTKGTQPGLPALKSIVATKEFQADPNSMKMIDAWQPVCRTWAAPGGAALFPNVTLVDSTPAMTTFAQEVLSLKSTPKEALTTLQSTLNSQLK
jgi:multiple sugar transport system substrate-binding protein